MTSAPRLSVVVASKDAISSVGRCLEALEAQRADGLGQVVLVDNSADGTADYVRRRFPSVEVLTQPAPALIPELWGQGILHSREEIVALTTAQMVAEDGWARAIVRAHASQPWAGVGGRILPAAGLSALDQAVYWLRYGRFAARVGPSQVSDIPGDNASYRRSRLLPFADRIERDGFWEVEIHELLRRRGESLATTPAAIVRYQGGTRFLRFAGERVEHGRRFGAKRVSDRWDGRRMLLVAAWPLTPFAFFGKIARDAARSGGSTSMIRALPALLCLLTCWSAGELLGYLFGASATSRLADR